MNIASGGAFRISIGRSFQSVEDEYLKCLSPNLVLVSVREGTAKIMVLADRSALVGTRTLIISDKIARCLLVNGFICVQQSLELHTAMDREPM